MSLSKYINSNIAGHRVSQRFTKGCTTAGVFFREPLFYNDDESKYGPARFAL